MKNLLLNNCQKLLPEVTFTEAQTFYWSPKARTIYMNSVALDNEDGRWSLLHEVGHGKLDHQSYNSDSELLRLEVEAWQVAEQIGNQQGIQIDPEHVQACLDTYRDWLYARSTCPTCSLNGLQIDKTAYMCLNCSTRWSVSASRFCRPYRMQLRDKKTPSELPQTVFV